MWGYPEFYIPVPGGYGTETHGHVGLAHARPAAPPAPARRRSLRRPRRPDVPAPGGHGRFVPARSCDQDRSNVTVTVASMCSVPG